MSSRTDIARHLRDIQLARARLAPLVLAELLVRTPQEAVLACGIDRALLLLVRDDELVPASVSDADHAERAADYLRAARAMRPRLADAPLEAEVVASRRPQLVADTEREPRAFRPLVALADTRAYVVAPLVHPD